MLSKFIFILSIITIICNIIIYTYVSNLASTKCECSKHWMRSYIKTFSMVTTIFSLINIIGVLINVVGYIKFINMLPIKIIVEILRILSLIYIVSILVYFSKLLKRKCECSNHWKRNILLYPIFIMISIFALMMIYYREIKSIIKKK